MTVHRTRRGRAVLLLAAMAAAILVASIAIADDASDREGYLKEIDLKLEAAASKLSRARSDSDDGSIRDAESYIDQVRDLVGRLERIKGDDAKAKEISDRYRFYAAEYGEQQHQREWSNFGCKVPLGPTKFAEFPGSEKHRKPDCIIPDKCEVWEFKPDSPSGHEEGRKQESDYEKVVPRYYNEKHRQSQPAEDSLGGAEIMKTFKDRCLRADAIELKVKVHYYKMCENKYECVRGD